MPFRLGQQDLDTRRNGESEPGAISDLDGWS